MLRWTWGYPYLFELVIAFHADKSPDAEPLNHVEVLLFILGGASILFPTVAAPCHGPTNSAQGSLVFAFLPTLISYEKLHLTFNLTVTPAAICGW